MRPRPAVTAIRGPALTFTGDPFSSSVAETMLTESDAVVAFVDGRITEFGPARQVLRRLPPGTPVENYGPDALIVPGFIDTHVHYPQTQIIGAYGAQLLDWLEKYTFVAEQQFADAKHARAVARVFLGETLRHGVTTACVFATVHPQSAEALFAEAAKLGLRLATGKVMMDRNAPAALRDTAQSSYDDAKRLIARWHGRDRLMYVVTPRWAGSSTPGQLDVAAALRKEHRGVLLQSHVSETQAEVAWMRSLFPERKGYLDIYDHHGLIGPGTIYGHGVWLTEDEWQRASDTATAIAHCPTSNFFLGSGVFDMGKAKAKDRPVRVGLATDVGAGTSFSMLQTMNEAYKAAQLSGYPLSAGLAFHLATRGGAVALGLHDRIGSIAPGMEADLAVLDMKSSPLLAFRMRHVESFEEALFVRMTLADDRAVRATWVNGQRVYDRAPLAEEVAR
jgi:guanine deaminase